MKKIITNIILRKNILSCFNKWVMIFIMLIIFRDQSKHSSADIFFVFDTMSTNILNYIKACRKTWNNTTQKELWYNLVTKKCAAHEWEFLWNILMRIKSKDKTLTKLWFWDLFHMANEILLMDSHGLTMTMLNV